MSRRAPAVAGRFYPADPRTLARLVDGMVAAVPVPETDEPARAYVVPHAGYRYSGPTAAHVYARLLRYPAGVDRVILLGPAHYVPLTGCAFPSADTWFTPLGEVPVDTGAVRRLALDGYGAVDDTPHAPEHSLEVQLPFLQRVLRPGTPVLPVVVGRAAAGDVAAMLAAACTPRSAGDRPIVLCSTDLSHYLDDGQARQQDAGTAEAVLDLAPERIGVRDACGVYALRGIVDWARQSKLAPELLHLATSADTAGEPTRVVGYAAFAIREAGGDQR